MDDFPRISVDPETGCWTWLASSYPGAAGKLHIDGRAHHAHRISYQLFIGPIPRGKVIDHLCNNRRCINPAHLEAVTHGENVRRGVERMPDYAARALRA